MKIQLVYAVLLASTALSGSEAAVTPGNCPPRCSDGWGDYEAYDEVENCHQPMMLVPHDGVNVVNGTFSACINVDVNSVLNNVGNAPHQRLKIKKRATTECTTGSQVGGLTFGMGWRGASNVAGGTASTVLSGGQVIKNYLTTNCQEFTGFYRNGAVSVAVWSGSMVQNAGAATSVVQRFVDNVSSQGISNGKLVQYCPGDPAKTFGISADTQGNFAAVQDNVKKWSMGQCIGGLTGSTNWANSNLKFVSWPGKSGNSGPDPNLDVCAFTRVVSGDGGASVAARCGSGMTADALVSYNPQANFSNLQIGQPLCCSIGKLPDLRPAPPANGDCFSYVIQDGDNCQTLALKYYPLSIADLMNFNQKTYGWMGCSGGRPWKGDNICLSTGRPPKPTPNPLAECGPLAPGSKYLSECPLKACCSSDGFCGIGPEHCTKKQSPTGAPGTTGCESNCDISYVQGSAPSSFTKVGYYESWSTGWNCMNGGIMTVDFSGYTHVHFSFADVGLDLQIKMDAMATSEFVKFKGLGGFKKIVSFGGWGISTDVGTYQHLRNAMLPANVDTVVTNLVNWMNANQLDGLDIDWEYPGAPDIPGIPAGLPSDAPNYLNFLKKLKAKMPAGKSLSIAAPASYWYLKQFPITDMAQQLDYIVYMTYDLHGQWDYGNQWTGNWLKSHVNWTETQQALNLITHAGVPSNKVLLGLGAYGRSFQQVDPNCSGPNCKFTGPNSGALPGKCTNAAGYISLAEIEQLSDVRSKTVDDGSTIVTYGSNQWVAYLTKQQMVDRTNWASGKNLGGTIVWAADLINMSPKVGPACDTSLISTFDDYIKSSCSRADIISLSISEIRKAIDFWETKLRPDYDQGVIDARDLISGLPNNKIELDGWMGRMKDFVNAGQFGNNDLLAMLYFYTKRCVFFNSLVVSQSPSKREFIPLTTFPSFGSASSMTSILASSTTPLRGIAAVRSVAMASSGPIGIAIGVVAIVAQVFVELWNKPSYPVPDNVMKMVNENLNQSNNLKILLENAANTVPNAEALIRAMDRNVTDIVESDPIPGPYHGLANRRNIVRPTTPYAWFTPSGKTQCDTESAVTQKQAVYTKMSGSFTDKEEKKGIPVYYVNYFGNSPGVACNAWMWFSYRVTAADDYSNMFSRKVPAKSRRYYLDKCDCSNICATGQRFTGGPTVTLCDKEEFPPATFNEGIVTHEGENGSYEISVACVNWVDNQDDGLVNLPAFYNASPPYILNDPYDPDSGAREGPIRANQSFIVRIANMPDSSTCYTHAKRPDGTTRYPGVINFFFDTPRALSESLSKLNITVS
ncbi:hypothetical protein GGH92_000255 [Coemansia sp. RSA 2673]|nr:hypothetical protein GGH92_000255 [Coemansia sp. RSA 2673]